MTARRLLMLALSLAAALYPGVTNGQREVRIPLHHGCGELVYTRNAGWSHCADTAGGEDGFVIKYVNDKKVSKPQDVIDIAKKAPRSIVIEGVTSTGRQGYFAFGKDE